MSWREGSSPPTMWRGIRTTLCRALRLPRCCFQTRRWCSRSGCSPQCRCRRIWGCWGSFQTPSLSRLRKKRRWCAFFSTASVWADHVRSSVMWTPRNLKLFTHQPAPQVSCPMEMGVCSLLCLLKSTTSSLVLSMLSERWFSWHHLVRVLTSSL